MKLLGIILLAVGTVTATARHRKEWQKGDTLVGRERFQTFYKSDVPACTRGEGFYRDPQDCHQFIRCVDEFGNGRQFSVFLGRCDPGLVFDENVSACNWPELAAPCSNSPQKFKEVQKPFKPETVPEDNVVSEGKTWNKPYPVEQQQVQQPQSWNTYETQQAEQVPVVQEIQIAAQEPLYQDKIEQVYVETQEPFQGQKQEPEGVQAPEVQEQVYQENVQVPEAQEQVYQENVQVPETQEQVYQENVQVPEVQQQTFEQHAHNEQNIRQSEQQQIIYQENDQRDRNQGVVRPEQAPSNGFQEVLDQETQQFGISQQAQQDKYPQESQSKWWVPEQNPQHNPPEVADQIPSSEVNQEPVFCAQEGFYRHPENCSQFIRCVKIERGAYAVHFFECPKQLVFNEKDSACIVADIHSCRNTRKKRQASNTNLRCKGEGFFRHPEDCRSFYRCVKTASGSYETHLFSCPANLVFDEEYTTCNWPEKAPPCESKQQSYKPTRKPVKPTQTERPRSQYKPPSRTTNRYWSTAKPRNDFMDKSITQETYGRRRSTERPKYTTQPYEKCSSPGFYKNDKDCTKFFKCVKKGNNFIRYDLSCPANFAYDERSKRCIAQRYVSSCNKNKPPYPPRQDDEETTTTSSPETSSSGSSSSQSGNDNIVCEREGYFRHPEDCNKFYRCVDFEGNGEEFVRYDFKCPEGLVFDEVNSVCNWPDESAPCDTRGGGGQGPGEEDGNETGGNGDNETGENEGDGERELENEGNASSTSVQPTTESVETTSSPPANENEQDGGSDNEPGDSGSENGCTKEGFYRNPEDCTKFYRCVDFDGEGKEFVRYDFSCPEGLVFDEANSVCNWPADSEPCDTRAGGGGTDTTSSGIPDRERESSEEPSPTQQTTPSDSGSPGSTPDRNPSSESSTDDSRSSTESTNESSDEGPTGSRRGGSGECTEEGFFRNPEDCNKFYRCVDQNGDGKQFVKYDFTCPEGLVFDEVNSVCNWPDQSAPCDGGSPGREQSTTSTTKSEPSESPQTTSSSRGSSESTTEGTTASTAPSTTERSTSTSSGESSSSTTDRSTASESTTSGTSDSGSKGSQGECTEAGFFRNPDDCNKFYRCVDFNGDGQEFVKYDFDCPDGLVFDEVNSVCNWPDQSPKCETRSGSGTNETTDSGSESTSQTTSSSERPQTSTEGSTQSTRQESTERSTQSTTEQSTTGSSTSSDSSECTEPGFHRCKDDCNKFYRCVEEDGNLVRYDFKCPDGLIFDDRNKRCDWPSSELSCDTESSGSTTTTTYGSSTATSTQASTSSLETSSSGSSRKECTEDGFFRDPDDCSKYYRCTDEGDGTFTREEFSCAEDEVFDEEMRYCNRKDLAPPCEDSGTTSSQTRTTSSTSQSTTTERSTTTTQTSTESSTTTTQTSTTESSTITTQSPTERSTTSTQSSTESSTKSDSSSECTEPGFFRCPEDCTKFYRCVEDNGNRDNLIRYDFQCPDGLIFDERNGKCDWPSSELTCDTDSSTSSTDSQSSTSSSTESSTVDSQTSETTRDTSSSGTTSSSGSTSSDGCTEEGFFRNPEDCSKYYRCIDEGDGTFRREDYACAEDEVFDEEMRYCNRKDLAPPCDGNSSTTESSVSSTSESSSEREPESTTSTSVTTSDSSSTTDSSGTTSASSNSSECTEEGFHRDPNDCSKFYRCVDFEGDGQSFTRYDFDCPEGLVFDETNDVCNWPSSVPSCESSDGPGESTGSSSSTDSTSGATSETSDSSTSSTTERQSTTTPSPTSTTPSPTSTTSSPTSTEQTSSTSGVSTSSSVQTSSDSSTSSGGRTTTSSSASTRGSGSSENIECTEEGFFRHPDDCNKFYRCVDFAGTGESFVRYDFDCPEGLVFDEVNSVCNWPTMSPSCESGSHGSSNNNESKTTDSGSNGSTTSSTSQSDSTPRDQTTRSTTSSPSSSDEFRCEEEGYFKHPTDCKKYYECKRDEDTGELVKIDCECPDGQVWDNEGWYCNAEELSPPCDGSSSSSVETSSDSSTSSTSSGGRTTTSGSASTRGSGSSENIECTEEGFFRHPDDCNKFYRCVDFAGTGESFVRYDFDCPEGLVFDEVNSVCNWPTMSPSCESGSRGSSNNNNESENAGSGSDLVDSGSTTSSTSQSSSTETSSSGNRASQSDSTPRDETTRSATSTTSSSSDEFRCEDEGYFKHPTDCKKYYECKRDTDTGELVKIDCECPDGQVWDNEGWYCNAEELSPPCNSSSSFKCKEEGFFRDPEDCTRYYQCNRTGPGENDFTSEQHQCGDGLVFDEKGRYCNAPELSEPCDGSSSTSSGTTSGESSGGTTSGDSSRGTTGDGASSGQGECTKEGFSRNPEDCTKYYLCRRNEETGDFDRTDYSCPDGRIFDEGSNYCNDPQLSEQPCDSDSTTTRQAGTNSALSSGSTSPAGNRRAGGNLQCTQEGFFRHPDDCSKFYRCVDFSGSGESFVRYDFDCPEGTHFDEVNSVCNWPTMTPRCESSNRLIV